jgi:serine/threonine protein kinase
MYRLEENQKFGQYSIIRYLGLGATGTSYEAQDRRMARTVVLKLIQPWSPPSDTTRRRFFRLMQDISYSNHPSLARIFNFGESHGHLYVARDYTPYGSLLGDYGRQWLKPPLPIEVVMALLTKLTQALAYLHGRGYAHGALTFTNIVIGAEPTQWSQQVNLCITDAGLAHIIRTVGQPQTAQLPLTAAPEQYKKQLSARSDQYALAILLYFWLTGRPPFFGMPEEIERAKRAESYSSMRTHNLHITLEQEIALKRALSAQPEARYQSIEDFVNAFKASVRVRPSLAALPSLPTTPQVFLATPVTEGQLTPAHNTQRKTTDAPLALTPRLTQSAPLPQKEPDVPQPLPSTDPLPPDAPLPEPAHEPQPPQIEPPAEPVVIPTPAPDIAQPLPDPTPFPFTPATEPQPEKENELHAQVQAHSETFVVASMLVLTSVNNRKVRFQLKQGTTSIGHAGASDILLEDDPQVSRHHALISYENGVFFLSDQHSTHGVRVNGHRLLAEQRHRLHDDDYIEIGNYTLIFSLQEQGDATQSKGELVSADTQLVS